MFSQVIIILREEILVRKSVGAAEIQQLSPKTWEVCLTSSELSSGKVSN